MGAEGEMPVGVAGDPLACFEERLGVCLRHLDKSVDRDTLEPLLVRLLLVAACGAYEKAIRGAVDLRTTNSNDAEFVRYLGRTTERYGTPFGTVSTKSFMRVLEEMFDTEDMSLAREAKETYRSLVQDRNSVAHGGETAITTLDELQ